MKKLVIFFCFLFVYSSQTISATPVNLIDPLSETLIVSENMPIENIRRNLKIAANKLGWVLEEISPNVFRATYKIRTHQLTVDITYGNQTLTAKYVSSINLAYALTQPTAIPHPRATWSNEWMHPKSASSESVAVIHPNYHVWVKQFLNEAKMFITFNQP